MRKLHILTSFRPIRHPGFNQLCEQIVRAFLTYGIQTPTEVHHIDMFGYSNLIFFPPWTVIFRFCAHILISANINWPHFAIFSVYKLTSSHGWVTFDSNMSLEATRDSNVGLLEISMSLRWRVITVSSC